MHCGHGVMFGGNVSRRQKKWLYIGAQGTRGPERARRCAQETPDPPEALTCMPSLQLSDIPKRAATIPTEISEARAGSTSQQCSSSTRHDLLGIL